MTSDQAQAVAESLAQVWEMAIYGGSADEPMMAS
jgi:hypothetical protein